MTYTLKVDQYMSTADYIKQLRPSKLGLRTKSVAALVAIALFGWLGWWFGATPSGFNTKIGNESSKQGANQISDRVDLMQLAASTTTRSGPLQNDGADPSNRGFIAAEMSELRLQISQLHTLEAEVLRDCPDLITWQKRARKPKLAEPDGGDLNAYLAGHKDKLPILQDIREMKYCQGLYRAVSSPSNKALCQYLFDKTAFYEDCRTMFGLMDQKASFQSPVASGDTRPSEVSWHEEMIARIADYQSHLEGLVAEHQIPLEVVTSIEKSQVARSENFLFTYGVESAIPPELKKLAKTIHQKAMAVGDRLSGNDRKFFMGQYDREREKHPDRFIHY